MTRTHELVASRPGTAVRKARVLHVITHLDPGGAQDNTLLTVEGLDRSRYDVDLVAGGGALVERARRAADRLVVLPSLHRRLVDPADASVLRALRRLCIGYDVVHTHGSKAGVLGRYAARLARVPVVVHTVHGFPVTPGMPWPVRVALLAVERTAARCSHGVVCVCDANAAEALDLRIATRDQVRVVVSGVPTPGPRPAAVAALRDELGIPEGAPVVGSVTRLMTQKAPLDLVAAARAVLGELPDAHVVVVGDGPLHAQVAAAGTDLDRLHLLGHRADVADLLGLMDVVVFSSLWEGLGRALTEAVLMGLPVVATAVNGVPDLVVDGVTGYLVAAGQPQELAARTVEVLRRPDRGRSLGAAGAARVQGRFGVEQMVAGVDATYRELLDRRGLRGLRR